MRVGLRIVRSGFRSETKSKAPEERCYPNILPERVLRQYNRIDGDPKRLGRAILKRTMVEMSENGINPYPNLVVSFCFPLTTDDTPIYTQATIT